MKPDEIRIVLDRNLKFQEVGCLSPGLFSLIFTDRDGDLLRFVVLTENIPSVVAELGWARDALTALGGS